MNTIETTEIRAIESDNSYTRYDATVLVGGEVYATIEADKHMGDWRFHTTTRMNREHETATAAAQFLRTDAMASLALANILDEMNALIPQWDARYDAERSRFIEMAKEREARQALEKVEWDKTHGSVTVRYENSDGWIVNIEDGGHKVYADSEFIDSMPNDLMHQFMMFHKTQGEAIAVAKKVAVLESVRKVVTPVDVYTKYGEWKTSFHKAALGL